MIESGQFRSGELKYDPKRGHQATATKTISMNENYSHIDRRFVVRVLDFAEIITLGECVQNLRAQFILDGNDEVGTPGHDL